MSGPRRRPADHVRVPLSSERTERIWRRLDASARRPHRGPIAAAVLVAAASLAVVGARRGGTAPPGPVPTVAIVAEPARPDGVTLADGSVLRPEPDARTAVLAASPTDVRVRLSRGAASLDVAEVPGRSFVLEAAGAEVHTAGARLRAEVEGDPPSLSLAVESGHVAVRSERGEELASLQGGQTWSLRAPGPVASAPAPRPEPRLAPRPAPRPGEADAPPRPDAPAPPPAPPARPAEGRTAGEAPAPPGAASLFAEADRARLGGQPAEAARLLERLCTAHPSDGRAGVAAFQLGRLRLHELGDPAGAAPWFRAALGHPSAAAYREDASADLVEALDRSGQRAACAAAREAFVAAHPSSPRLAAVARRCPSP